MKEKLDFIGAQTIMNALALESAAHQEDLEFGEVLAILDERFVLHGIESWTLVDAKNQPIPITRRVIREIILSEYDLTRAVADSVDDRYRPQVFDPLAKLAETSSRPTPTGVSTSPKGRSSGKPRTRSSRSSITSIPTAATETTSSSLDGDSSLSPKSVSAA